METGVFNRYDFHPAFLSSSTGGVVGGLRPTCEGDDIGFTRHRRADHFRWEGGTRIELRRRCHRRAPDLSAAWWDSL